MIAAASFARSMLCPTVAALAIGGFVPEDEPGVDEGVAAGDIDGWPFPGVLLVVQPNAAREHASAIAEKARKPLLPFCLSLMFASCTGCKSVSYLQQLASQ